MKELICVCQADLEAALRDPGARIKLVAPGEFKLTTRGLDNPYINLEEGASLIAVALESSRPIFSVRGFFRLIAREDSSPEFVAEGGSRSQAELFDEARLHATANEYTAPTILTSGASAAVVLACNDSRVLVKASHASQILARTISPTARIAIEGNNFAQISAFGAVLVFGEEDVTVLAHGSDVVVKGGRVSRVGIKEPEDWQRLRNTPQIEAIQVLEAAK